MFLLWACPIDGCVGVFLRFFLSPQHFWFLNFVFNENQNRTEPKRSRSRIGITTRISRISWCALVFYVRHVTFSANIERHSAASWLHAPPEIPPLPGDPHAKWPHMKSELAETRKINIRSKCRRWSGVQHAMRRCSGHALTGDSSACPAGLGIGDSRLQKGMRDWSI